jgi:hypothetical protein
MAGIRRARRIAVTSVVRRAEATIGVLRRGVAISVARRPAPRKVAAMTAGQLLRAVVLRDAAISADRRDVGPRLALPSVATSGVRSQISGAARARRIAVPPVNRNAAMTGVRRVRRKASAVEWAAASAPADSAAALVVGLADAALVLAASAPRALAVELRLAAATSVVRKPARVTGAMRLARAMAIGVKPVRATAARVRVVLAKGLAAMSGAARRKGAVALVPVVRALAATSVALPKVAVVLAPVVPALVAMSGAVPMLAVAAPVPAKAARVRVVPVTVVRAASVRGMRRSTRGSSSDVSR